MKEGAAGNLLVTKEDWDDCEKPQTLISMKELPDPSDACLLRSIFLDPLNYVGFIETQLLYLQKRFGHSLPIMVVYYYQLAIHLKDPTLLRFVQIMLVLYEYYIQRMFALRTNQRLFFPWLRYTNIKTNELFFACFQECNVEMIVNSYMCTVIWPIVFRSYRVLEAVRSPYFDDFQKRVHAITTRYYMKSGKTMEDLYRELLPETMFKTLMRNPSMYLHMPLEPTIEQRDVKLDHRQMFDDPKPFINTVGHEEYWKHRYEVQSRKRASNAEVKPSANKQLKKTNEFMDTGRLDDTSTELMDNLEAKLMDYILDEEV